jgi:WD40 repeat protein/DNA-binding winged helix-turn-helix (wHTH) protein
VAYKADFVYEFGGFRLHAAKRILLRNGEQVALTPKVFDTLMLLVQKSGQILEKDELMRTLWPESFVEESNLSQNIFILRKVLGGGRNGDSLIQTIPRRGYRFATSVTEIDAATWGNGIPKEVQSLAPRDYWSRNSPFRGLQVFEPEDAWLFFGRDMNTEELLARLGRSAVLTIVGNSGSGKSSLIRAGLIPALRAGRFQSERGVIEDWRVIVFRPSASPFDYLAEVLPNQLLPELSVKDQAEFIAECRGELRSGGHSLRNAISALAGALIEKNGPARILLVVDQFEEIFTLTRDQGVRDRYIDALLAASGIDSPVPVHLVLAVRADFYAQCLEHAELSRCLQVNLYNVPRMSREQLRETLEKRLSLAAARAEPGLIDSLLEEVGSESGNLALLEHALGQLWKKCGGFGCTLTNQAYVDIGRLRGALGRHADEVYASIEDEKLRVLAQKILLELVQVGDDCNVQDTRRRVPKEDLFALGSAEEIEPLIAYLASARLIFTGKEGEKTFVEVSHEALIRQWPALREWLTQNREELRLERRLLQISEEWKHLGCDPGALLQGTRLAQAEEWLVKQTAPPSLVRQYVQASVEARAVGERTKCEAQERELAQQKLIAIVSRRSAVRQRWYSSALSVLMLAAVAFAWVAYREQIVQKSSALAARSGELLPRDHGQALDLAIRSWGIAKTEESRFAVVKAFLKPLRILEHQGPVAVVTFSPDGQRIVSASYDHTARLWSAKDGHLIATLEGHKGNVNHAAFSPDGQHIVTASDDATARIWDGTDGHFLFTLRGHSDKVWRAAFSPDGRRIVTASYDHTARIWNTTDGRLIATLPGHSQPVVEALFSPDGQRIVTGSVDKTARVWNAADGHLLAVLKGHTQLLWDVAFSPDGQWIVTAGYDGTARVWSSADYHLVHVLQHDGAVASVQFSRDSQRIVTAGYDSTARVWNTGGSLSLTLRQDGPVQYAEFSPDGQRIITASFDHTARVWNSANGQLLATLQSHSAEVYHAAFSPSGEQIATAGADGTVRLWNCLAGRSRAVFSERSAVYNAAFSPDGQRVVTSTVGHQATVWGVDGGLLAVLQHADAVWDARFSQDGRRIITASMDHTARLWDAANGSLLATLEGHTDSIGAAEFSPDGRQVVTASADHTARLWSTADGRLLSILQGHTGSIRSVHFSPDGRRIVTASYDHTARVWNSSDGRLLAILRGHADKVSSAQFSPDGKHIITSSHDKTARLWDADGKLLAILQGHADKVSSAQFSPDGKTIVTASEDNTARVWNSSDGRLLVILLGHTDKVSSAQFSPDGLSILTASYDNTARVWDSSDGHLMATLQGHWHSIMHAAFSPDGHQIVTASYDNTARVWQLLTLHDVEQIIAK